MKTAFASTLMVAGVVAALTSSAGAVGVTVSLTADNSYTLWADGAQVLGATPAADNWRQADVVTGVSVDHLLAVRAVNQAGGGDNPAALLASLIYDNGQAFVSGADWKVWTGSTMDDSPAEPAVDAMGRAWYEVGYDDSGWVSATEIVANGGGIWGQVLGGPVEDIALDAKWIWSANWDLAALTNSPVYFRFGPDLFPAVPEPLTVICVFLGAAVTGEYCRRRLHEKS